MSSDSTRTSRSRRKRLTTALVVFWFLAGTFGDEYLGMLIVGLDAFGIVLFSRWWWAYQASLLAVVVIAALLIRLFFRDAEVQDAA